MVDSLTEAMIESRKPSASVALCQAINQPVKLITDPEVIEWKE